MLRLLLLLLLLPLLQFVLPTLHSRAEGLLLLRVILRLCLHLRDNVSVRVVVVVVAVVDVVVVVIVVKTRVGIGASDMGIIHRGGVVGTLGSGRFRRVKRSRGGEG